MKSLISYDIRLKVPFYDVDPMKVVWHGHYIKYFEQARCALLDVIGYGYREMEMSGYSWPVIDLQVRYVKPATLGQELICTAGIVEYENRLKIVYEIRDATSGRRLTRGQSIQVAVEMQEREMQLVSPVVLHEKMAAYVK